MTTLRTKGPLELQMVHTIYRIDLHEYIYIYICIHMHTYTDASIHLYASYYSGVRYIYIYTCIHVLSYMHIYIYAYTGMYGRVYIYIYTYMYTHREGERERETLSCGSCIPSGRKSEDEALWHSVCLVHRGLCLVLDVSGNVLLGLVHFLRGQINHNNWAVYHLLLQSHQPFMGRFVFKVIT